MIFTVWLDGVRSVQQASSTRSGRYVMSVATLNLASRLGNDTPSGLALLLFAAAAADDAAADDADDDEGSQDQRDDGADPVGASVALATPNPKRWDVNTTS